MYLVRKKRGGKAHYWEGTDTKCRMASTGGLSMRKYLVTDHPGDRLICHMCMLKNDDHGVRTGKQVSPDQ